MEEKNKTSTEFVEEKRWEGDELEAAGANKRLREIKTYIHKFHLNPKNKQILPKEYL